MTYIFFTSKDCGLCKQLKPKIDQIKSLDPTFDIHIKDAFQFAALSKMCGVGRLPTLVVTEGDNIIEKHEPEQVASKLNAMLKDLSKGQ